MCSKILLKFLVIAFIGIALLSNSVAANTARTCYTCSGINCMRTTLSATQQCIDPLDYCVTIFDKFNVVRKGCSMEVPIELRKRCDMNTRECHKCNTDRCNNLGQANYLCLQCDSSKDTNCSKNPMAVTATRCPSPTSPNSYCYVKQANGVIMRGCSTTVADQLKCYADANCALCLPGDMRACNNFDFVAGSSRAHSF